MSTTQFSTLNQDTGLLPSADIMSIGAISAADVGVINKPGVVFSDVFAQTSGAQLPLPLLPMVPNGASLNAMPNLLQCMHAFLQDAAREQPLQAEAVSGSAAEGVSIGEIDEPITQAEGDDEKASDVPVSDRAVDLLSRGIAIIEYFFQATTSPLPPVLNQITQSGVNESDMLTGTLNGENKFGSTTPEQISPREVIKGLKAGNQLQSRNRALNKIEQAPEVFRAPEAAKININNILVTPETQKRGEELGQPMVEDLIQSQVKEPEVLSRVGLGKTTVAVDAQKKSEPTIQFKDVSQLVGKEPEVFSRAGSGKIMTAVDLSDVAVSAQAVESSVVDVAVKSETMVASNVISQNLDSSAESGTKILFNEAKVAAYKAQGLSLEQTRVMPPSDRSEKKSLNVDLKNLKKQVDGVGTFAANSKVSMIADALESSSIAINPTPLLSASIERAWHIEPRLVEDVSSAMQSQAVHVVREIKDIADGLWATERNSVELKFNFGANDQLSVRVEYRNGDVRATFRTNSDDLRATLSDEWQSQAMKQSAVQYTLQPAVFEREVPVARSSFSFNDSNSRGHQEQASQNARDDARQNHEQRSAQFFANIVSRDSLRSATLPSSLPRTDRTRLLHTHA